MSGQKVEKTLKNSSRIFPETDNDEIVISGMGGRFPNSRNISEFKFNLFNKVSELKYSVITKTPKCYTATDGNKERSFC